VIGRLDGTTRKAAAASGAFVIRGRGNEQGAALNTGFGLIR